MRSFFQLVPHNTAIPFIRWRLGALILSCIAVLVSLGVFAYQGMNYGIDFRGGIMVEIKTPEPANVGELRRLASGLRLGQVEVLEFGDPQDILFIIERQPGEGREGEAAQQAAAETLRVALREAVPNVEFVRSEVVGGKVSGELAKAAATALALALVFMLGYIAWRFEYRFAIGAVLALVHDVILTIGMFSITGIEFNLASIAAVLTIIGYSMNDTVVVYDRVREMMRKYKKMPTEDLLNLSINRTLSRTMMTSLTTLIALGSLYILGGEVLRGFSFAMIWGVVIGTYSSIFIAAPILLLTGVRATSLDDNELIEAEA